MSLEGKLTIRPIRPKPLMPTLVTMVEVLYLLVQDAGDEGVKR